MKPLITLVFSCSLTATVLANSATDMYKVIGSVFDAMISTSNDAFKDSVDSDKVMSSLLCPLADTMSKSIEAAIKATQDGKDDDAFEDARSKAKKKGEKFEDVTMKENKYVCPSMNKLTKDLNRMKRDSDDDDGDESSGTSKKDTYKALGQGVADVADACVKDSSTTDVVCPIVDDLTKSVEQLSDLVDTSANAQKTAKNVIAKCKELVSKADCDGNDDLKSALGSLSDDAGLASVTASSSANDKATTITTTTASDGTTTTTTTASTTDGDAASKSIHHTSAQTSSYEGTTQPRSVDYGTWIPSGPHTGAGITGELIRSEGVWSPTQQPNQPSVTQWGAAGAGGASITGNPAGSTTNQWPESVLPSSPSGASLTHSNKVYTTTGPSGSATVVTSTVPFYAETGDLDNDASSTNAPVQIAISICVALMCSLIV